MPDFGAARWYAVRQPRVRAARAEGRLPLREEVEPRRRGALARLLDR